MFDPLAIPFQYFACTIVTTTYLILHSTLDTTGSCRVLGVLHCIILQAPILGLGGPGNAWPDQYGPCIDTNFTCGHHALPLLLMAFNVNVPCVHGIETILSDGPDDGECTSRRLPRSGEASLRAG